MEGGAATSCQSLSSGLFLWSSIFKVCHQVCLVNYNKFFASSQTLSPDLPPCPGTRLYCHRTPPCCDGEERPGWDQWQYSTHRLQSDFRTGCCCGCLPLEILCCTREDIAQFSGACWTFDLVVGGSWCWRWDILDPSQTGPKKDWDNSFYLSRLKLNQKGSRGLAIAGACSCVSGLGLLLLPQLGLDVNNGGKDGSEMLAAAVPALLGVGDGLINLQVLLFYFQGCDLPWLILTLPNLCRTIYLFSISWPAVSPWLILFCCLCLLVGLNIFVHLQLTSRLALTDLDSAAAHFALYKLLQSAGTCLGEYIPLLFSGSMSISLCTSTRLCR